MRLIDFSVEWKSIFEGAFTGEVVVVEPHVTFGFGASHTQSQTGEEVDWVQTVQHLMPITINRFAIQSGLAELTNVWETRLQWRRQGREKVGPVANST